jgi:hypothetical protein
MKIAGSYTLHSTREQALPLIQNSAWLALLNPPEESFDD